VHWACSRDDARACSGARAEPIAKADKHRWALISIRAHFENTLQRRQGREEKEKSLRSRALRSRTWPSSTSRVSTSAASKYVATVPSGLRDPVGKIPGANAATTLWSYPVPTPGAIKDEHGEVASRRGSNAADEE
jgi:hypothetical protein